MKRFVLVCVLLVSCIYGQTHQYNFLDFSKPAGDDELPHKIQLSFAKTELEFGGWLQLEKSWWLDSPRPQSEHINRRSRLYFTTTTRDLFTFMFMVQGDRDYTRYHYIYLDILKPDYLQLRIGLFKKPFSLEQIYSSRYLWTINRSLGIINYQHILDIGIAAHGSLYDERFEYGLGVFNGNQRNLKNNANKEICGRFVICPFLTEKGNYFQKLRIGSSIQACEKEFNLSGSSFTTGQGTPFLTWNNNDVRARTQNCLAGGDIEWLIGPTSLRAEFLLVNWVKVNSTTVSSPFKGYSWYLQGGYILTGENAVHNTFLTPKKSFNFKKGGGAFEIVGRIEAFKADHRVIKVGLATGTSFVSSFTLGLNYYFNPSILSRLNWQISNFHKNIIVKNHKIRDESVITLRFQGEF